MNPQFEQYAMAGLRTFLEELYRDLHDTHATYCEIACTKFRNDTRNQKDHTIRCDEMARKYGLTQRTTRRIGT